MGKGEMASGDIHLLLASRAAADASSPKKEGKGLILSPFLSGTRNLGISPVLPLLRTGAFVRSRCGY